ncbi:MAG: enoyl-CoA hydratase-related protein, partial [Syntrophales bacterium]|nr:enoyl-CoA hydratase-related protein [Syntrophales bacterium]
LDMGLINEVAPTDRLEETVMKLAGTLSQSATRAIGMTKVFLHKVWQMDLQEALAYEAKMQGELVKTEDHQQAAKAFLNKTKPSFRGR